MNIVGILQRWMDSKAGQTFLNYAYSWGASIVILGTLFKLTHLPGANLMLFIGMGTEVVVFFLSAFDRPFEEKEEAAAAMQQGTAVGGGAAVRLSSSAVAVVAAPLSLAVAAALVAALLSLVAAEALSKAASLQRLAPRAKAPLPFHRSPHPKACRPQPPSKALAVAVCLTSSALPTRRCCSVPKLRSLPRWRRLRATTWTSCRC